MRQTTEHRSYVGSGAVLSRHDLAPTHRSSCRRPGFTLVEVVVAAAILIILIIGLSSAFARAVDGFKQAQLLTLAQNLAEFQVEDLKNLAPSVLNQLVLSDEANAPVGYHDINYPYPTLDPSATGYDASAASNDVRPWMYDSGKLSTDFIVDGIERLGDASLGFVAGWAATEIPLVPTDTEVLLGANIFVRVYLEDASGVTYWKESEQYGFYYIDGGTGQRTYVGPPVMPPFDPEKNGPFYFYQIVLQKEAYPLFSRQIRIAQYDVSLPAGSDPWNTASSLEPYRDSTTDSRREFEYEVTIWYKQNGVDRVLFRAEGTIASPFVLVPAKMRRMS